MEVSRVGLQVVWEERISAKEDREMTSVLEETGFAQNSQPLELVPVTGGVGSPSGKPGQAPRPRVRGTAIGGEVALLSVKSLCRLENRI
jgi:hypothetical protein